MRLQVVKRHNNLHKHLGQDNHGTALPVLGPPNRLQRWSAGHVLERPQVNR